MLPFEQRESPLITRQANVGTEIDIPDTTVENLSKTFLAGFHELSCENPYYKKVTTDYLSELLDSQGPMGFAFYQFYFDNHVLLDIAAYWEHPLSYPLPDDIRTQQEILLKQHDIFESNIRHLASSTLEFVSPSGFTSWEDFQANYFSTIDGPISPFLVFKTREHLRKIDNS